MLPTIPTQDLLIEIGCEELPPKHLKKWQEWFLAEIAQALNSASLPFKELHGFIAPRRIAVRVTGLAIAQPDQLITKKGPTKSAAFDQNNQPTKAALGFAESCGVPLEDLSYQITDKGSWLVYQQSEKGAETEQLIPAIVEKSLNNIPIGKRMRWSDLPNTFARPIHWIVLVFGQQTIEADIMGVKSGNLSRGHRFLHPSPLEITSPAEYEHILLTGFVIADFTERQNAIRLGLAEIAKQHHCEPIIDPALLDEVTGLVEWPVTLFGSFEQSFLEIPQEVLITSMQVHQKCFPVVDTKQNLLPHFLIVSNIKSKNPAEVVTGNEWVMHARLADAAFYYRVDRELSLAERREGLKQVRFQKNLGTLWDKTERLAPLSASIAKQVAANPTDTERAAILCKSDLLTQMVGEFPELQGIMGRYYAQHDGENILVATAIEEHYYPRFAADILPNTLEGTALALADRLDSLVGLFGQGHRPTGDKDPFALRRQAFGVVRILIEKQLDLDLIHLLKETQSYYKTSFAEQFLIQQVMDFCFDRLKAWYSEQNISLKVYEAVHAKSLTNPLDFHQRIHAVQQFGALTEAESLAAANKRVKNILEKTEIVLPKNAPVDSTLLQETPEKNLNLALNSKEKEIQPLLQDRNYTAALKSLAALKEPIDVFFNEVMVMTDDEKLRHNRLILLTRLRSLFLEIADISLL